MESRKFGTLDGASRVGVQVQLCQRSLDNNIHSAKAAQGSNRTRQDVLRSLAGLVSHLSQNNRIQGLSQNVQLSTCTPSQLEFVIAQALGAPTQCRWSAYLLKPCQRSLDASLGERYQGHDPEAESRNRCWYQPFGDNLK